VQVSRHPAGVARRCRVDWSARRVRGRGQVGSVSGKAWRRAHWRCGGVIRSVVGIGTLAHIARCGAPRERTSVEQRLERCARAIRFRTRRVLRAPCIASSTGRHSCSGRLVPRPTSAAVVSSRECSRIRRDFPTLLGLDRSAQATSRARRLMLGLD
jgi:hypothetical protein